MSQRQPNTALRDAVRDSGLTYDTLARLLVRIAAENGEHALTNRSSVAHWISGVKPSGRMPSYIAEALSRKTGRPVTVAELGFDPVPGNDGIVPSPFAPDPLASLADLGRADLGRRLDRRSVLFSAALLPLSAAWLAEAEDRGRRARERGGLIGAAEVDAVRSITEALNRADETLGGGHGREAVVQYLVSDVAAYCSGRFRSDADRRAMFGSAAELAYLAGWKSHDIGQEGLAQLYYAKSLQLAREADPHGHAAWALRILAHQSLDLDRPEECASLADQAWDLARGRVDPSTEALFAITAARAGAANNQRRSAIHAVHRAEDSLTRGGDDLMPHWAALSGPAAATVASHVAKTFTALGDHAMAEERYAAAAELRGPEGFRRIHALNLAQVAEAQAAQGHVHQACDSWGTALTYMHGVASDRHRKAIGRARRQLRGFVRRGVPGAAHLDQQFAEVLAAN